MPPRSRSPFHWLALALLLTGCGADAREDLSRLAPELPPTWVEALTTRSEEDFRQFARAQSAAYLNAADAILRNSIETGSFEEFEHSSAILDPALTRIRRFCAEEYGFDRRWLLHQMYLALPRKEAYECGRLTSQYLAIRRAEDMDPSERFELVHGILQELEDRRAPLLLTPLMWRLSEYASEMGDRELRGLWLEKTVAAEPRYGNYRLSCQALGVLGSMAGERGDDATMLREWDRGLEIALRHRLPIQTHRLLSFLARYQERTGHLAVSREMRRSAERYRSEFGGGPASIASLVAWLDLNARMGCWEVVERDLRRADLDLHREAGWVDAAELSLSRAKILEIRARLSFQSGSVQDALDQLDEADAEIAGYYFPDVATRLRLTEIQGRLDNGEAAEAREVADHALATVQSRELRARLLLLAALVDAELEDWESCARMLGGFESMQLQSSLPLLAEWTQHDVLEIRLSLATADTATAVAAVTHACSQLESRLRARDAIQEGHLILRDAEPLRAELHRIVAGRADLGFLLELRWRELARLLRVEGTGRGTTRGQSPLSRCVEMVVDVLEGRSERFALPPCWSPRVENISVLHLLYRADKDSLVRWEHDEDQLRRVSTGISERQLQERVSRILHGLEAEAGTSTSRAKLGLEFRGALFELAQVLLPSALFEENRPRILLLSPDGPLQTLPFGVLNLAADGYRPLIERFDPVYRGMGTQTAASVRSSTDDPSALIVADPRFGAGHWLPGVPPLARGLEEARAVQRWVPNSKVLTGREATRSAVLQNWGDASLLYFATHVVHDAEAPYITYIPLAADATRIETGFEVDHLEPMDVRSTTLRANPLVVLSACSSGAPYVVRGAQAPGFGDAFLQAGASTVIQTLWSVRDDAAAALMETAMHAWAVDDVAPWQALNDARRAQAKSEPYAHPYFWGSAVVMVGVR